VPQPSASEVKKAIEKVKRHKAPAIEQIPAEMMLQQERETSILRSTN
jgi:hypothetical protein